VRLVIKNKKLNKLRADARMVIRIFCKKIDLYDRDRFDSFSAHFNYIYKINYEDIFSAKVLDITNEALRIPCVLF
jgi:hypothetical protein